MTPSLVEYIESEIIPRYASFDKAHREDHARTVIDRAMAMGEAYDIDENMLYAAAACHDLGLAVDRKTHHLESGRIIRADARLAEWFSPDQIETIAQAAEDHRASATTPPRSIYGCLVAEADRLIPSSTRKAIGSALWSICTRNMRKEAISTFSSPAHPTRSHWSASGPLSGMKRS